MNISSFLYNIIDGNSNIDFFQFLGYKIYLDDLLIVAIIYCLYKEGVEDQLLLMSLLLLLFS